MKMTTIVSIAAAALLTSGALAIAAPGHGGNAGADMHGKGAMHGRMAEKLGLTDAQKTQVKELMESFRSENQALLDEMKQTRGELREARQAKDTARAASLAARAEEQRAALKTRREAQHEKMLQLLTPEQRTEMQQMHEKMQQRRGAKEERGKGMGGMKGHAHHGAGATK